MKKALIASLLSLLGPGLGQIYNREHKKGWLLIVAAAILFIVPTVWIMKGVGPIDPASDPLEVQALVLASAAQHKHTLNLITFVFLGLWAYSITQAYFKARELTTNEPPPPEES